MSIRSTLAIAAALTAVVPEAVVAPKPEPRADATAVPAVKALIADAGSATIPTQTRADDGSDRPVFGSEVVRYVLVRGVWPGVADRPDPAVDLSDFELERRPAATPGTAANAGWEPIDLRSAKGLFDRCRRFADVKPGPEFTNPVVTCPLPDRADRAWGDEASHPRLARSDAGGLVLFRYLDPTPRPGVTYRYRVRLRVRGPDAVAARGTARPKVISGPERWTEWSAPTEPIAVPRSPKDESEP